MTDIKSQILSEVEEHLGSGYVQTVHEAMEKCPTLIRLLTRKMWINPETEKPEYIKGDE